MPKNAVQRLKNLHDELRNVISIYDETNEKQDEALDKETDDVLRSKRLLDVRRIPQKIEHPDYHLRNRTPYRRSVSFIPRPVGEIGPCQNTKKKPKPDSAPSFSSGLTTISESDYHIHLPPEQKKCSQSQVDNFFSLNVRAKDEYADDSDWSNISSSVMCEIILSPSKTLETANEILKRNNYRASAGEKSSDEDQTTFEITDCRVVEDSSEAESTRHKISADPKSSVLQIKRDKENCSKKKSTSGGCELPIRSSTSYVNVSASAKKSHPKVQLSKSIGPLKNFREKSKVKSFCEMQQGLKSPYNKSKSAEKEKKTGESTSVRKQHKKHMVDLKEKKSRVSNLSLFSEGNDTEKMKAKDRQCVKKPTSAHEKSKRKMETIKERRGKSEEDIMLSRKLSYKNKIEDGSGEIDGPCIKTSAFNIIPQAVTTKEDGEKMEEEVKQLSRILEENNEKLEKMKVSKDLALDIAKQLKDKYDEIRNSKNELIQRLQKAEISI